VLSVVLYIAAALALGTLLVAAAGTALGIPLAFRPVVVGSREGGVRP
jgi:hypothetical protein